MIDAKLSNMVRLMHRRQRWRFAKKDDGKAHAITCSEPTNPDKHCNAASCPFIPLQGTPKGLTDTQTFSTTFNITGNDDANSKNDEILCKLYAAHLVNRTFCC